MTVEIPKNIAYISTLRPLASAAVCVQPDAGVGQMWGRILLAPHFALSFSGLESVGQSGQAYGDGG
jgi:hypothetical protein